MLKFLIKAKATTLQEKKRKVNGLIENIELILLKNTYYKMDGLSKKYNRHELLLLENDWHFLVCWCILRAYFFDSWTTVITHSFFCYFFLVFVSALFVVFTYMFFIVFFPTFIVFSVVINLSFLLFLPSIWLYFFSIDFVCFLFLCLFSFLYLSGVIPTIILLIHLVFSM